MPRIIIKSLVVSALLWTNMALANTYQIKGVDAGDTLNMRQQPGTSGKVLLQLPASAQGIVVTGKTSKVDSTTWVKIRYQGKTGWVGRRFLTPQGSVASSTTPTTKSTKNTKTKKDNVVLAASTKSTKDKTTPTVEKVPVKVGPAPKPYGSWILECGSASPYWKAEILPKSINLYRNDFSSNVPITFKNQLHGNKHQKATSTVVVGERGKDRVSLTIRYSGQCSSSLAKRKVTFRVSGKMNGETVSGCCYSYPMR